MRVRCENAYQYAEGMNSILPHCALHQLMEPMYLSYDENA